MTLSKVQTFFWSKRCWHIINTIRPSFNSGGQMRSPFSGSTHRPNKRDRGSIRGAEEMNRADWLPSSKGAMCHGGSHPKQVVCEGIGECHCQRDQRHVSGSASASLPLQPQGVMPAESSNIIGLRMLASPRMPGEKWQQQFPTGISRKSDFLRQWSA